jgi:hypothetical protein
MKKKNKHHDHDCVLTYTQKTRLTEKAKANSIFEVFDCESSCSGSDYFKADQ